MKDFEDEATTKIGLKHQVKAYPNSKILVGKTQRLSSEDFLGALLSTLTLKKRLKTTKTMKLKGIFKLQDVFVMKISVEIGSQNSHNWMWK